MTKAEAFAGTVVAEFTMATELEAVRRSENRVRWRARSTKRASAKRRSRAIVGALPVDRSIHAEGSNPCRSLKKHSVPGLAA